MGSVPSSPSNTADGSAVTALWVSTQMQLSPLRTHNSDLADFVWVPAAFYNEVRAMTPSFALSLPLYILSTHKAAMCAGALSDVHGHRLGHTASSAAEASPAGYPIPYGCVPGMRETPQCTQLHICDHGHLGRGGGYLVAPAHQLVCGLPHTWTCALACW